MKGCGRKICGVACCTVLYGDSLKILRQFPSGRIDLCATDPPYGIEYQSNKRVQTKKFEKLDNDDNDHRLKMYRLLHSKLKMNAALVTFCSFKNFAIDMLTLQQCYKVPNTIIWWKGGGGIGDLKHSLVTDYEMAIVAHKGDCSIRGKRDGSVWVVGKVHPGAMEHATQKPVALFERIIEKWSDPGDLVLDPYCGRGTCLIAAKRCGRHFIGCELDHDYYRLAQAAVRSVEPVPTMKRNSNSHFEYFDVMADYAERSKPGK